MNLGTGFDRRHPRSVIIIRVLVTAWLLGLTGILLANSYWGWALLTLAGAVANIVWAYRVWRATIR
ncbi:MAG TPA: hypothetical protein VHO07_25630 [Streptosporangiaceae bacterium]|jgi:hypothetical protein|nr:hypothetical protein [Streptosporangiaceae bacterium]